MSIHFQLQDIWDFCPISICYIGLFKETVPLSPDNISFFLKFPLSFPLTSGHTVPPKNKPSGSVWTVSFELGQEQATEVQNSAGFQSSQALQQVISQIGTPSTGEEKWITWCTLWLDWKPAESLPFVEDGYCFQSKVDKWLVIGIHKSNFNLFDLTSGQASI